MKYIASNKITVYPTAYRKGYDNASCLNTEENTTNLKKVSNYFKDFSFIEGNDLILYIQGYMFRLDDVVTNEGQPTSTFIETVNDSGDTLYATIKLKDVEMDNIRYGKMLIPSSETTSLTILDDEDSGSFIGLGFTNDITNSGETSKFTNALKIAEVKDGSWVFTLQPLKLSTTEIANGDVSNKPINEEFTTAQATISQANINNASLTGTMTVTGSIKNGNGRIITLPDYTASNKDAVISVDANGNLVWRPYYNEELA